MSKVTFNGVTKIISVNVGVTALDIRTEVYSEWVRWLGLGNTKSPFAMRYTGLDVIPGGFTGDTYFLVNGWKLVVDLRLVRVRGTLFSDNFETAYFDAALAAQYPVQVSSLVNTVTNTQNVVTGDISSIPSAAQNATAVWNQAMSNLAAGSAGAKLNSSLTIPSFLALK